MGKSRQIGEPPISIWGSGPAYRSGVTVYQQGLAPSYGFRPKSQTQELQLLPPGLSRDHSWPVLSLRGAGSDNHPVNNMSSMVGAAATSYQPEANPFLTLLLIS